MRRPPGGKRMFDGSSSSSSSSSWVFRKRFHFFKIICPAIIQQKRLGLPKKFIRKFGKELSEVVVLTVPNGTKWHIELKEIEGETCLENGWQEFVDYYSIGVDHFLVFGYDGSSCFHVLIFGMSSSEMEYPCHIKDFKEPNQENADGYDSALQEESSDHVSVSRSSYSTMFLGRWPATTLMTRVARAFKSDNPYFLVIMRSTYVNEPFMLNVPSDFAREHFKQDLDLTLLDSEGRSWQVRCGNVISNAKIYWGWMNFAKENHLEEGDVCVFELVNRHNFEMKVIIYRARN